MRFGSTISNNGLSQRGPVLYRARSRSIRVVAEFSKSETGSNIDVLENVEMKLRRNWLEWSGL